MIICLHIILSRVKDIPPLLPLPPLFFFMYVFRRKEIEFGLGFQATVSLFSERHYEL